MSKLGYLLGGALLGVAGLATAAYLSKDNTDKPLAFSDSQDVDAITEKLQTYYFKSTALALKCTDVVFESNDLQVIPLDLPDASFLERSGNKIGGAMTVMLRKWKYEKLLELKQKAEQLYATYQHAFVAANALLQEQHQAIVSCKQITFVGKKFSPLNYDLNNDSWIFELDEMADTIRSYLNTSAEVAEQLISKLEALQKMNDHAGDASLALPVA